MSLRSRVTAFTESPRVTNAIIAIIILNAIILGLETSKTVMDSVGPLILALDQICLSVFVVELLLKLFAHRLSFFRNGWNIFDFIIVGIALVPSAGGLSVLRALRILRVLRVLSVAPSLRRVVEGFITALPGMGSVFLLMAIIFWFGTLGLAAYSLFQVMTLESWSMGIARPVMEVYPYAWAFFVPFILVTTFAVVNLLVGLIVNSMQDAHHQEDNAATDAYRDDVLAKLEAIEKHLKLR